MIAMARQPVECKLVSGMAETSSITKKSQVPPGGATRTGIDQGQRGTERDWARCEMADGRWQQGTPASFSTGWAGLWTLVGRGAVERRGGKGTIKTIRSST